MAGGSRLTYRDVADRIEAALGVRPAPSTLRAAAAVSGRGATRARITAGLPAPLPEPDAAGRTVFDAGAIDQWLAQHPRNRIHREQYRLAEAGPAERAAAVAHARGAGLSWQQVAEALGRTDGKSRSRQWAQQRFGQQAGNGSDE